MENQVYKLLEYTHNINEQQYKIQLRRSKTKQLLRR